MRENSCQRKTSLVTCLASSGIKPQTLTVLSRYNAGHYHTVTQRVKSCLCRVRPYWYRSTVYCENATSIGRHLVFRGPKWDDILPDNTVTKFTEWCFKLGSLTKIVYREAISSKTSDVWTCTCLVTALKMASLRGFFESKDCSKT